MRIALFLLAISLCGASIDVYTTDTPQFPSSVTVETLQSEFPQWSVSLNTQDTIAIFTEPWDAGFILLSPPAEPQIQSDESFESQVNIPIVTPVNASPPPIAILPEPNNLGVLVALGLIAAVCLTSARLLR